MDAPNQPSFLGLAPEIRVTIYRLLFQDLETTTIRLRMYHSEYEEEEEDHADADFTDPMQGTSMTVDDGITLTSHFLRQESMPVLKKALSLECNFEENFHDTAQLDIVKVQYLRSIRHAHIKVFAQCISWNLPYEELASLELFRLEYGDATECPNEFPVKLDDFLEWDLDRNVEKTVQSLKTTTLGGLCSHVRMSRMMEDRHRGFKVECRDSFFSLITGNGSREGGVMVAFEWDTLHVLEGLEEIKLEVQEALRQKHAAEIAAAATNAATTA